MFIKEVQEHLDLARQVVSAHDVKSFTVVIYSCLHQKSFEVKNGAPIV
jgi:hypothetical protein